MNTRQYISTREEWQQSIDAADGRKWLLREKNPDAKLGDPDLGATEYIELVEERNPYAHLGEKKTDPKAKAARHQMKKKTSRHGKGYTWRLGYHRCVGQYTGDAEYPEFSGSSLNRKKTKSKKSPKREEPAIHIFSDRSKAKVKDKATAFYRAIPKDRIFLTMTFIQHVTDEEGVKILNKFLTVVRKEKPGFDYLRVAEHQQLNPMHTIHFHILMNKKLAIRRYNALWVLQQYNAGLRGRRADGSEIPFDEILGRYKDGTIGKVLNPVDICRAYGINALAGYLTKYITKQKKEEFRCLNWHCSRKVSRLFTRQVVSRSTFSFLRSASNYRIDYKTGECFEPTRVQEPFFSMIQVHNRKITLTRLRRLEAVNRWMIQDFLPDSVPKLEDNLYRRIFANDS